MSFAVAQSHNRDIDGVSWAYEAEFDEAARTLALGRVLVGEGELAGGVIHGIARDSVSGRRDSVLVIEPGAGGRIYERTSDGRQFPWGTVMAATIVVTLPLIVATLVLQRRILAGLTAGAVKG